MTTINSVGLGLSGSTGTGDFVGSTSPTLVTPALGTPTSGTLTNCTGLPVAGGGTGDASFTAYMPVCGGTSTTGALQSVVTGTAGYVLTYVSGSALPTWQANPAAAILQVTVQTITATGAFTYTPTAGTAYAIFELQGGGGGSGGVNGGITASTGGGAGGGYLKLLVSGSTNLANITGSVGIAGTAGSSSGGNGGAGGNTTLTINSGTQWVAPGGPQSNGATTNTNIFGGNSIACTVGTNGTLIHNVQGQPGGTTVANTNAIGTASASSGAGYLGLAAYGNVVPLSSSHSGGAPGTGYGVGASGSCANNSAVAGAVGTQGIVIITEFGT